MIDAFLHTVLGFALSLVAFAIGAPLPTAIVVAAFIIYFREVTQLQVKLYDCDIRKGWDPRYWSRQKNLETWFPVSILLLIATLTLLC